MIEQTYRSINLPYGGYTDDFPAGARRCIVCLKRRSI